VGEVQGQLGADFTHLDAPRLCSESRKKPTGILERKKHDNAEGYLAAADVEDLAVGSEWTHSDGDSSHQ
jgi:hypothetical protein